MTFIITKVKYLFMWFQLGWTVHNPLRSPAGLTMKTSGFDEADKHLHRSQMFPNLMQRKHDLVPTTSLPSCVALHWIWNPSVWKSIAAWYSTKHLILSDRQGGQKNNLQSNLQTSGKHRMYAWHIPNNNPAVVVPHPPIPFVLQFLGLSTGSRETRSAAGLRSTATSCLQMGLVVIQRKGACSLHGPPVQRESTRRTNRCGRRRPQNNKKDLFNLCLSHVFHSLGFSFGVI